MLLLRPRFRTFEARRRSSCANCHRLIRRSHHQLFTRSPSSKISMAWSPKSKLWEANMGIRFSPTTKEKQPLYPQLDVTRFIQTGNVGAETSSGGHGVISAPARLPTAFNTDEAAKETQLRDQGLLIDLPPRASSAPPAPLTSKDTETPQKPPQNVDPPSTSLSFQISAEKFHRARNSPPGSQASYWSYEMYEAKGGGEGGLSRNVKVHYCKSKQTMELVCKQHFLGCDVLGFDMEWWPGASLKNGPRLNVSLIQLASESHVGLFHVALFLKDDFVAPTFRQIMEDPGTSKVGVNIKGDCTRLRKYLDVHTRGVFELSHLYKVVKYSKEKRPSLVNKRVVSMASQVEEYLQLPLFKGDSVRSSNWSYPLNARQITYSASDAYAGLQLYHVLEKHRQNLDPCPPRPHHAELEKPLEVAISPEDEVLPTEESLPLSDAGGGIETPATEKKATKPGTTPKKVTNNGSPSKSPSASRAPRIHRDSRIVAAELEMQTYRSTKRTGIYARPAALRAYYIWHSNDDLKPGAIAKLLRDPPLQTNTVTSYIIEAVSVEKLPYDKQRMKDELLSLIEPSSLTISKYQTLVQDCQFVPGP